MMSLRKMFIIAFSFVSCSVNPRVDHYFEKSVLKRITQLTSIQPPPPVIGFGRVYIIGNDDRIYESSCIKLKEVYNTLYKNEYPAFEDFLFDALNQRIKIDTKDPKTFWCYSQPIPIDPGITRAYKKEGIKGLMNGYCFESNGLYTLKKEGLSMNEINTISYYFFINQYLRVDDDYEATINFEKLDIT